jgi:hypothetical protein
MPAIVIVISLSTGIVVLYHGGHNPSGLFAEVYDYAQPAAGKRILTIVALAITRRIQDMKVRACDRVEDRIDVVEQPRSLCSEVQVRASIEHDAASIWIDCAGRVIGHRSLLRQDRRID